MIARECGELFQRCRTWTNRRSAMDDEDVPVLVSLGDEDVPVCEDGSCAL
jgi:hypothetical protein